MIKWFKPYFLFIVPGLVVLMLLGSCRSTSYPQKRKKNKKCDCPRWTQNNQPGIINQVNLFGETPLSANHANSLPRDVPVLVPGPAANFEYSGPVQVSF